MVKRKPPVGNKVFQAGVREGHRLAIVEVLTYLQDRYMDRAVARNSAVGKAILEVAADMSAHLKEKYTPMGTPKPQQPEQQETTE